MAKRNPQLALGKIKITQEPFLGFFKDPSKMKYPKKKKVPHGAAEGGELVVTCVWLVAGETG